MADNVFFANFLKTCFFTALNLDLAEWAGCLVDETHATL